MKRVKENRGFTLLELLTVLVIMSALAVIAIPVFMNKSVEAKQVAHNMNVSMLESQAQLYLLQENVTYPQEDIIEGMVTKGYIKEIPKNPLEAEPYVIAVDAAGIPTVTPPSVEITGVATTSAYLSALTITGASSGVLSLSEPFNGQSVFGYDMIVDYDDSSIIVEPISEDSEAYITVNTGELIGGQVQTNLAIGINTITIEVIPEVGEHQMYIINVTRPSSAYLDGLDVKVGVVSCLTSFARDDFSYDVTVTGDCKVLATLQDTGGPATMEMTVGNAAPVVLSSGVLGARITMVAGSTVVVKVEVTSKIGGVIKTYTMNVTRP